MSTDRVNELRELLRAHRADTSDIYQPIREATGRQNAALLANRELESDLDKVLDVEAGLAEVLRARQCVDDGLDRLFRRLGPPADRDDEK